MTENILSIGDKIRVIDLTINGLRGVIISKIDEPDPVALYKIEPGRTSSTVDKITWWKVKIDGKDEVEDVPSDLLVKVE
jgi:hypothetical protein